jgi:RNA 2',3'-cyclic 3'-phosphodiesterase
MRAFVAIDLPGKIREELARCQRAFAAVCPDARWTNPEGIHLTLKFLGEISSEQVRQVTTSLAGLSAMDTIPIEVRGFGFFPDARRPRVFWAGVRAPEALSVLARRVEEVMEKLGFPREQRDYNPHLTLARFKVPRPQPVLVAEVEKQRDKILGSFEANEFYLYESQLTPRGARYRQEARFPVTIQNS